MFNLFEDETANAVCRCCVRMAIGGGVILLPFTLAARKLLLRIFIRVHGLSDMKLEEAKKVCAVELPYKFFSSLFSGLMATLFVPSLLQRYHVW